MWKTTLTLACASAGAVCFAGPTNKPRTIAMARSEVTESSPVVLQNRFFTKQLRAELGVSAGSILNESYSQTSAAGARMGLFLTEKVGIEYNFAKFKSRDSVDLLALRSQEVCAGTECRSIQPHYIRLEDLHQLQMVTAPVYGKINLFDWAILYSDLTFSAGMGRLRTSQGNKWAFTPSVGQRFYFSKSFSLRLDATDVFLRDSVKSGVITTENWRHNWIAQIGLSAFLNSGD
jgi:outer membrane beta-barrel protein